MADAMRVVGASRVNGVVIAGSRIVRRSSHRPKWEVNCPWADTAMTGKDPFGLSSFITPTIVKFLGNRSLVRFGATSEFHKGVMLGEVERRRMCIVCCRGQGGTASCCRAHLQEYNHGDKARRMH